MTVLSIKVSIQNQKMIVYRQNEKAISFPISTSENGSGCLKNSNCTPTGSHIVRAMIGKDYDINSVFVGRRFTGEIYNADLAEAYPNRDWILTRIIWLSGCEIGLNRLGNVDTMQRYIYIHGTPDSEPMGRPKSHGCIRMRNKDLVQLFDVIHIGCPVHIVDNLSI